MSTSLNSPFFFLLQNKSKLEVGLKFNPIPSRSISVPSPNQLSFLKPLTRNNPFSISPSNNNNNNNINPFSISPSNNNNNINPFSISPSKSQTSLTVSESLKRRLQNGETLYGMFLCSFNPILAEIAGLSGYDFVVVDMEHGYGGISEALSCMQALSATQTPAILRLPETSAVWAKKAMDLGPQGIMFPMIEGPDEAVKAVSYCRYPPIGVRGAAHPVVRASGYGTNPGYLNICDREEEVLLMCQVESEFAASKVAEIAAVEGVDCIQMGPTDLSASMGYLWDPGNKKVMDMMKKIEKAVLDEDNCYLAGFAMPHDSPEQLKGRGYHMVSGCVDLGLFRNAAAEDVKRFRISIQSEEGQDKDGRDDDDDDDDKYWSE